MADDIVFSTARQAVAIVIGFAICGVLWPSCWLEAREKKAEPATSGRFVNAELLLALLFHSHQEVKVSAVAA